MTGGTCTTFPCLFVACGMKRKAWIAVQHPQIYSCKIVHFNTNIAWVVSTCCLRVHCCTWNAAVHEVGSRQAKGPSVLPPGSVSLVVTPAPVVSVEHRMRSLPGRPHICASQKLTNLTACCGVGSATTHTSLFELFSSWQGNIRSAQRGKVPWWLF